MLSTRAGRLPSMEMRQVFFRPITRCGECPCLAESIGLYSHIAPPAWDGVRCLPSAAWPPAFCTRFSLVEIGQRGTKKRHIFAHPAEVLRYSREKASVFPGGRFGTVACIEGKSATSPHSGEQLMI